MTSLTDTHSAQCYERALRVLPGGVNSPVRAMRAIGRDPVFVERAHGAELFDVDGNRYVDYVCSWGPLIHGHTHPHVLDAVERAAREGTSFGAPTPGEVTLAEEVARRMEAVEMLRMTSSGTEATMTALRLARAATGRERVLKFAGAYHGHVDGLLAQAGSGLATQALPSSPGVPAAVTAGTVVVPWNDAQALEKATAEHEFAAIIAEGIPANMGLVPAPEDFMELLRACATANGALLLLDEVISGFRVARGGAQELYGVQADLTIMGKILGGGLPAGAVGGRAELLELLAPAGAVYQAGTLSGNPLAVAAGLATLELLDEQAYLRLAAITEHLAQGLRQAAAGYPVQVVSRPGLLTVFFSEHAPRNLADAQACDLDAYGAWCRGLLARGVYPPPSQFEAWFPSLAHTPEHIEQTVEAAHAAFRELTMPAQELPAQAGHAPRDQHAAGRQAGASPALTRLEDLLREQGGLLAGLLPAQPAAANGHGPAQVACAGPRCGEGEVAGEYELLVEAIYEGYLLHYDSPRLLCQPEADLGLLAGDQLYALGLSRLVALGDLAAVAELADVITLTALAHGAGEQELAEAIWDAGAYAVGWGPSPEHEQAKALARAGSPDALAAMRAVSTAKRYS
jgi:glutamate-1-semialdehyde 2,1-aminomutase